MQAGWLVPLYRGVFQVGPTTSTWGNEIAALLACGPDAALSHQSAAAVWGFGKRDREIHITAPAKRRSRPGVRVHRTASLDAVVANGLRVTRPHRTLRDLRRTLPAHELERAEEQAHVLGLVIPDGAGEPEFTRSEGEQRLKALCRAAGLPAPRTNVMVSGYEVDAYWPESNLIVEVDGYRYHRTRRRFERDRRKDASLLAAGHRVVRITWRRLTTEPISLSAQLGALLAQPTRPSSMRS